MFRPLPPITPGRPTDKRITAEYLAARNLPGQAFVPGTDIDLIDSINDSLSSLYALVSYADPGLGASLADAITAATDATAAIPGQVSSALAPVAPALADVATARAQLDLLAGTTPVDNEAALAGRPAGGYRLISTGELVSWSGAAVTQRGAPPVSTTANADFAPTTPHGIARSFGGTAYRLSQALASTKMANNVTGRYATHAINSYYYGDAKFTNGASGVAISTNFSSLSLYQITNTISNSEVIKISSTNFGSSIGVGFVLDQTVFGGTANFGYEIAVRDGNIVPSALITAITATTLSIGNVADATLSRTAGDYSYAFAAGVNTRAGEPIRGHPLLNYTRRVAVTSGNLAADRLTLTVSSTVGLVVGDYIGFDADTYTLAAGNARTLHRIASVPDATTVLLDSKYENAGLTYGIGYQGASTSGAMTSFPATLPSGYAPYDVTEAGVQTGYARQFTFNTASHPNCSIDPRFQVGDLVFNMPSARTNLIAAQVDLTGGAPQAIPVDLGFVVANNNTGARKARAAILTNGGSAGFEKLICAVGKHDYLYKPDTPPLKGILNVNDAVVYMESGNPITLLRDGAPGSLFLRTDAPDMAKVAAVKFDRNTLDWRWIQHWHPTGFNAASMPVSSVPGFAAYVIELDRTVFWSATLAAWTVSGVRVIGTTAQRPTSGYPRGFQYYDTTLSAVVSLTPANGVYTDVSNAFATNQGIVADSPRLDFTRPAGGTGSQLGLRYYSAPGVLAAALTYDLTNGQIQLLNGAGAVKAALSLAGTVRYSVFTRATLPSPTSMSAGGGAGATALVNDPVAGKSSQVWSDGAIWRYTGDNSAV